MSRNLFIQQLDAELKRREEKAKAMGIAEMDSVPLTLVFELPLRELPILAVKALVAAGFITDSFRYHNSCIGNYVSMTLPSFDENVKPFIIALVSDLKSVGAIIDANVNFEVKAFLDVSMPYVGQDHVWAKGYKGVKVPLAVLDTGKPNHADLVDRVVCVKNYVGEVIDDLQGHSTHCFGIAGVMVG